MSATERWVNCSSEKPRLVSNAGLACRMLPAMSPIPIPMAAPSNMARNRASLTASRCSVTRCALCAARWISSCSDRVSSRSSEA